LLICTRPGVCGPSDRLVTGQLQGEQAPDPIERHPLELRGLAIAEQHEAPRAADARAWALHRLGRDPAAKRFVDEALRLGSRDPLLRYHAGAIEAALGDVTAARRDLELALATDPGFSATGAAEARRLLETLGVAPA